MCLGGICISVLHIIYVVVQVHNIHYLQVSLVIYISIYKIGKTGKDLPQSFPPRLSTALRPKGLEWSENATNTSNRDRNTREETSLLPQVNDPSHTA